MTLAVREVGRGRPMVLLPAFSLGSQVMAAGFEPALESVDGVRRLYVDLPGCGSSAPVEPRTDAVVQAVIDELDVLAEPVILVGWSYGGYVAAAVTRRRPELVRALALVCSGVRIGVADRTLPDTPRTQPLAWPDQVAAGTRSHLDLALATDDIAVATRVADLVESCTVDEDYLIRLQEHGYPATDEDDPTAYDGPVLMQAGRQDRVGGYVDQFAAMTRYPRGTYLTVDGAGHYLPFEQPEMFAAVLTSWLATTT